MVRGGRTPVSDRPDGSQFGGFEVGVKVGVEVSVDIGVYHVDRVDRVDRGDRLPFTTRLRTGRATP